MEMDKIKIDVSVWTITKVVLALFGLFLLYYVRDVLALLFVVFILVVTFRPVVISWGKKIGKPLAISSLILIFITTIAAFIAIIIPPLVNESNALIKNLPDYISQLSALRDHYPSIERYFGSISSAFSGLTSGFFAVTANVFGGVVTFLTLVVLTIYFLADEKVFPSIINRVIPDEKRSLALEIINKISQKTGDWLRGQLLLGLIVGAITYVGALIIGIPYALVLGVIAGILEILPTIGPIVSGIIGTAIAFTVTPITGLVTLAFYVLVQQLENTLLVPKVMQKAVGLPAPIIIIAILLGAKLMGIIGAILAVPITSIIYIIASEWDNIRKKMPSDAS